MEHEFAAMKPIGELDIDETANGLRCFQRRRLRSSTLSFCTMLSFSWRIGLS